MKWVNVVESTNFNTNGSNDKEYSGSELKDGVKECSPKKLKKKKHFNDEIESTIKLKSNNTEIDYNEGVFKKSPKKKKREHHSDITEESVKKFSKEKRRKSYSSENFYTISQKQRMEDSAESGEMFKKSKVEESPKKSKKIIDSNEESIKVLKKLKKKETFSNENPDICFSKPKQKDLDNESPEKSTRLEVRVPDSVEELKISKKMKKKQSNYNGNSPKLERMKFEINEESPIKSIGDSEFTEGNIKNSKKRKRIKSDCNEEVMLKSPKKKRKDIENDEESPNKSAINDSSCPEETPKKISKTKNKRLCSKEGIDTNVAEGKELVLKDDNTESRMEKPESTPKKSVKIKKKLDSDGVMKKEFTSDEETRNKTTKSKTEMDKNELEGKESVFKEDNPTESGTENHDFTELTPKKSAKTKKKKRDSDEMISKKSNMKEFISNKGSPNKSAKSQIETEKNAPERQELVFKENNPVEPGMENPEFTEHTPKKSAKTKKKKLDSGEVIKTTKSQTEIDNNVLEGKESYNPTESVMKNHDSTEHTPKKLTKTLDSDEVISKKLKVKEFTRDEESPNKSKNSQAEGASQNKEITESQTNIPCATGETPKKFSKLKNKKIHLEYKEAESSAESKIRDSVFTEETHEKVLETKELHLDEGILKNSSESKKVDSRLEARGPDSTPKKFLKSKKKEVDSNKGIFENSSKPIKGGFASNKNASKNSSESKMLEYEFNEKSPQKVCLGASYRAESSKKSSKTEVLQKIDSPQKKQLKDSESSGKSPKIKRMEEKNRLNVACPAEKLDSMDVLNTSEINCEDPSGKKSHAEENLRKSPVTKRTNEKILEESDSLRKGLEELNTSEPNCEDSNERKLRRRTISKTETVDSKKMKKSPKSTPVIEPKIEPEINLEEFENLSSGDEYFTASDDEEISTPRKSIKLREIKGGSCKLQKSLSVSKDRVCSVLDMLQNPVKIRDDFIKTCNFQMTRDYSWDSFTYILDHMRLCVLSEDWSNFTELLVLLMRHPGATSKLFKNYVKEMAFLKILVEDNRGSEELLNQFYDQFFAVVREKEMKELEVWFKE